MSDLRKSIEKLKELIKGLKSNVESSVVLPSIKNAPTPGVKPPGQVATKIPQIAPTSDKSPVKQAEQIKNTDIKDMKMREATEALNVNKSTGQWSIEELDDTGRSSDVKKEEKPTEDTYHIHQDGAKITSTPLTIRDIEAKHGGVKKLEGAGYKLHLVKPNK